MRGGLKHNKTSVILVAVSIWTGFALLLATGDMAGDMAQGRAIGRGALVRSLISATIWAMMIPIIIMASRRFSVLGVASLWRLSGLLLIHLGIGIALTFLHDLATTFVLFVAGGGAITDFAPFSNRWLMHITRNPFPATYAVVAGITWLFISGWKLERERTVRARIESERRRLASKVLEQNLQPHLLFNALQAIGLRNTQASGDLQRLAAYLRMILDGRHQDLVPVEVERNHLEVFLNLARVRFADRDLVEITLEPGCEAMRVPAFSFQTLVENALQHGDQTKKIQVSIAKGSVLVHNRIKTSEGRQPGWGIGLSTLRSRLDMHYDGQATLEMKSDGTHCDVEMTIPVEEETA